MIPALFGIATITALGWAIYNVFAATIASLDALTAAGWAAYLGVDPDNTIAYLYQCLVDSLCAPVLGSQWVAHYRAAPLYAIPPALIATIVASRLAHRPKQSKAPGQAHWGTTAELKREGYIKTRTDQNLRGYFGIHKDSRKMIQLPEHIRYSHCLVIGGPGARKSTGYHKQNIIQDMRDGVNIIVFDLKYPDPRGGFFDMVTLAADHYGYDVQLMLPYDQNTHRYSLLAKATTEQGAREVASMILPPVPGESGEFYRNNERLLLTGLILAAARMPGGSLKTVVDVLRDGFQGLNRFIKEVRDPDVGRMTANVLDGVDTEKQKGILTGLLGKLEVFGDPDLLAFGQLNADPRENIDLRRFANTKTILYIGIPQQKLGANGQMFLQLVKRSIDNELGEVSREHGGVFPIPISYYLDEFANFGPLPDIGSDFATMRSRRLAYHVTVQNMAQGAAVYGHQEWESFYRSNFQSVLIFPRYIRFGDAELFSRLAGNLTSVEQSTSDVKGGLETRHTVSTREVSRPLMSAEEMKEWPQAEGVAFLNGVAPVRVVLPRLDEKHVRGYKNPYYEDYTRIPERLNPYEWTAAHFARIRADRKRQLLDEVNRRVELMRAQRAQEQDHQQRVQRLAAATTPASSTPTPNDANQPTPATAPTPQPQTPRATTQPPAGAATAANRAVPATTSEPRPAPTRERERDAPKGVRRFNQFINTLIRDRVDVAAVTVSKRRRILDLAFPATPDLLARLEPHHDLLVKRSKFLMRRGDQIALTRAGLAHLDDNYARHYYKVATRRLSRQQRAALLDPHGPELQLPISHTNAKNALRREIKRLARGNHLKWARLDGRDALAAPLEEVDDARLRVYGAYWKHLGLATARDDRLYVKLKVLKSLPRRARETLPPRPEATPSTQPATSPARKRTAEATPPEPTAQRNAPTDAATTTPRAQREPDHPRRRERPAATPERSTKEPAKPHVPEAETVARATAVAGEAAPAKGTGGAPPADDTPTPTAEATPAPRAEPEPVAGHEDPRTVPGGDVPMERSTVTPPGLKPMPDFARRPAAVIVKPGESSDADTAVLVTDSHDRAAVLEWIDENKRRLLGHPEAAPDVTKQNAIGRYAGKRYILRADVAERLLKESGAALPPQLRRFKNRIAGEEHDWVTLADESVTVSEEMFLIAQIAEGRCEGAVHHLEAMLEMPLDEAAKALPEMDWRRVQATLRGTRAYVKVSVVAPPERVGTAPLTVGV